MKIVKYTCFFFALLTLFPCLGIVTEISEVVEVYGRIKKVEICVGKFLNTAYKGACINWKSANDVLIAHLNDKGGETNVDSWKEFIDDPMYVYEQKIRTNIYFPIE